MNGLMTFKGIITPLVIDDVPPADALSFVRRLPAEAGIDHWCVQGTGSARADCALGERLGAEYLEFIGRHPTYRNSALLGQIVAGMARNVDERGRLDPAAIGFLRAVNEYAIAAATIMAWPREDERHAGR